MEKMWSFLKKRRECGVMDVENNQWMYERLYTSDFPDDSKWSLTSDGSGGLFTNKNYNKKYCSEECSWKAERRRKRQRDSVK